MQHSLKRQGVTVLPYTTNLTIWRTLLIPGSVNVNDAKPNEGKASRKYLQNIQLSGKLSEIGWCKWDILQKIDVRQCSWGEIIISAGMKWETAV